MLPKNVLKAPEPLQRRDYLLLGIILLVGALLRFYRLEGTSLFNDELSALLRLQFPDIKQVIEKVKVDGHPAGVQVFLYYWTRFFGDDVITLRLPFVIFSVLSILASYAWARLWFGNTAALFTAASVALLQFPIFYSQLARPYAPGLLFAMWMVYCWTKYLFYPPGRAYLPLTGFILAATLCTYTHQFSMLFAAIVGITGLFFLRGKRLLYYVLAGITICLLYLPHLPILLAQLQIAGLGWLGRPEKDYLFTYIFYIFNDSWLVLITALLIGIYTFVVSRQKSFRRFHGLTLLFFLLPLVTGFAYSYLAKPVLQYSCLLFSFPFLLAFLFSFTGELKPKIQYGFLVAWGLLCMASLIWEKDYYNMEQYGQFRPLAVKTIAWDKEYGAENITHTINLNNRFYMDYYTKRMQADIPFKIYRCDSPPLIDSFFLIVKESRTPYFMYAWSNIANLPIIDELIRLKYPRLVEEEPHFNSGIRLYGGKIGNTLEPVFSRQVYTDSIPQKDPERIMMLSIPMADNWSGRVLSLSGWMQADSISPEIDLVVSVEHQEKVFSWQTAKLAEYLDKEHMATNIGWQVKLPGKEHPGDLLKVYLWNRSPAKVSARRLTVEIY